MHSGNKNLLLKIFFGLLVGSFVVFASAASSNALEASSLRYQIGQEISSNDGVLVSRPKTTDLKIMNLIQNNRIRTIDDYARWLQKNVRYAPDQNGDHWAQPMETLHLQKGDCEDFSFLNTAVLKTMGYQTTFLALSRGGRSHAICVFKENGYYSWFDNATLKRTQACSLAELAKNLTQNYGYSLVRELNPANQSWQIVYQKS